MKIIDDIKAKLDGFQQRHAAIAFPIAVVKRYGDEKAGQKAALLTYYAFLSLFPMLMIFITILGILAAGNPELGTRIEKAAFEYFPALGDDLRKNVETLGGRGLALILQGLIVIYGARGLAVILQDTFNDLWRVPKDKRAGFPKEMLRSFAMMLAVGLGLIIGSVISYILGSIFNIGIAGIVLINIANLLVTFGLFLTVFRLGTASTIKLKSLILGAIIATIGILIVQRFGGYIMAQQLTRLEGLYGSFAVALGMLFWLYLQAQIIVYAVVTTVVRTRKDWPKELF